MDDQYEPPDDYAQAGDVPPQDKAAEASVLGAMMQSSNAILDVIEVVRGEDFYFPHHETIYDTILALYSDGKAIDMVTVGEALTKAKEAQRIGGLAYLHTLVSNTPVVANAEHYANIVREKAILRRLMDAAARVNQIALKAEGDVDLIVDRALSVMDDVVPRRKNADYVSVGDMWDETLTGIETASTTTTTGLPTGFYDLDDLLGGLAPGQMVVVAGRPGMGKSTIALDFARSCSMRHGFPSVFFSLEMTRQELSLRVLSAEAKVPLSHLRSGNVSEDDWNRIAVASQGIATAPLFLDDSAGLTMTEIRAKARRLRQTVGLNLIIVDYLQLMSSGKRVESRQTEVSEFSRQIKLLAKELLVPVIAVAQLNRGPEQRTSKRPLMSDLRESGGIENDADIVILLHREDYYEQESDRPGEADIIVAKHRNGATRDITVAAQLHYSRFADLAR